jgi:copper chaperone CopZ
MFTMQSRTFVVPNIGCDGCVRTIVNELKDRPGVAKVSGDVASRTVSIGWDAPMTWEQIAQALKDIDYAPEMV